MSDGQQRLLRHLLGLFEGLRVKHQQMARARGPVRVDLQFKHAHQVAAYRLDGFENRFLNMGPLLAGVIRPRILTTSLRMVCRCFSSRGRSTRLGEKPA